jgi:hypothetical protein
LTELVIGISVLTCLALALALPLLIRKIAVSGGALPVTAEWIDELSVERYRPMIRLLDGEDLAILRSQPGFKPEMLTKLRIERSQIFRGHLTCLNADFARVCAALKVLMLQSRNDRPDLAATLVRRQATFIFGMLMVRVRLFLYRWGLCGVDVTSLVKVFDTMCLELRTMVPASSLLTA